MYNVPMIDIQFLYPQNGPVFLRASSCLRDLMSIRVTNVRQIRCVAGEFRTTNVSDWTISAYNKITREGEEEEE